MKKQSGTRKEKQISTEQVSWGCGEGRHERLDLTVDRLHGVKRIRPDDTRSF